MKLIIQILCLAIYSLPILIIILLQTDVSKVIRYSRKLPDKESSLIKVMCSRGGEGGNLGD